MKNSVMLFEYDGSNVSFRTKSGVAYVNATEMAKSFDKQPSDWTKTKSSKIFIDSLSTVRNIVGTDLIKVVQGGSNQGTWMHEDVAIEFSRWLSPAFSIWCNDRIKELVNHGFTATDSKIEELVSNPDLIISLATELKNERIEKALKDEQLKLANNTIVINAPKIDYYNTVLQSSSAIKINVIAQELGISATKLNKKLKALGVVYRQGDNWLLYSKHRNKGLTVNKTIPIVRSNGETGTATHMYWTEKGRLFIHNLITPEILKVAF